MTQLLGFHHVALTVRNRDASAEWYASVLGFEELFREENDERRAAVMQYPGGTFGFGVVEHFAGPDDEFDPRRRGLDHVGFTVGSREALDDWERRLTDAGVSHSGVIETPRGGILNFRDPDGIALAFFWDR